MSSLSPFRFRSLAWLSTALHVGGIACALGIIVVGWQVRLHLRAHVAAAIAMTEQAETTLTTEQQVRTNLTRLESELAVCQSAVKRSTEKLVEGAQESRFMAHLGQLAEDSGIEIRNFRPGRMVHRGKLSELELQLSCEGTYVGLCAFLEAQEELPRFCHVASLAVTGQPGDADALHFDLTLQLLFKGNAPTPPAPAERK